jgi:hypothetical protein
MYVFGLRMTLDSADPYPSGLQKEGPVKLWKKGYAAECGGARTGQASSQLPPQSLF